MFVFVEASNAFAAWSSAQTSVQRVSPGVIPAGDRRCIASRYIKQSIAAVLADVVEGADFTVLAFGHDDALLQDVVRDEVSRCFQIVHMCREMPTAEENLQPLLLEHGRIIEIGRR